MNTTTEQQTTKSPVTCSICGAGTRPNVARPATTYADRGTYRIDACEGCGCGLTVPRPSTSDLEAFYATEYEYDAHVLIESEKRWRARHILDLCMPPNAQRILDIGCMYGYLLEEAKRRGVPEAKGIELSTGPAKAAQAAGLDVYCGTIESFAKKNEKPFDLIVAQHVLEHVPDLDSFLRTARSILSPTGTLCICVPNFKARTRQLLTEGWGWYQVPVHLWHFTDVSLEKLLFSNGFSLESTKARGGDSLFVLLTLLQSLGSTPRSDRARTPGVVGRTLVRTASLMLRPYYFVGDDELVVLAKPTRP